MNYRITHETQYRYSEPVTLCHNEARLILRPVSNRFFQQTCISSWLTVTPRPDALREQKDFFGNRVTYFSIQHSHTQLNVKVTSEVQVEPAEDIGDIPHVSLSSVPWEDARDQLRRNSRSQALDARQFALDSPMVSVFPDLAGYAERSFPPGRPILEAVYDLMQRIYKDFKFVSGFTTIATPLSDVLNHRQGVCQDFAHVAVGCLRAKGLAARYVSGYIETLPPPGQERMAGADASHAWFSVYVPDIGWADFDPTNNLMPKNQHITLAWGRDYSDVTPLKGVVFSGGQDELSVSVDVQRIEKTP